MRSANPNQRCTKLTVKTHRKLRNLIMKSLQEALISLLTGNRTHNRTVKAPTIATHRDKNTHGHTDRSQSCWWELSNVALLAVVYVSGGSPYNVLNLSYLSTGLVVVLSLPGEGLPLTPHFCSATSQLQRRLLHVSRPEVKNVTVKTLQLEHDTALAKVNRNSTLTANCSPAAIQWDHSIPTT